MRYERAQALIALHYMGDALCPLGNGGAYSQRRRNKGGGRLSQGLSVAQRSCPRRGSGWRNRFQKSRGSHRVRARSVSARRSDFSSCCLPGGASAGREEFQGQTNSYEREQYEMRAFVKHNSL
jgi:hypothetical protein